MSLARGWGGVCSFRERGAGWGRGGGRGMFRGNVLSFSRSSDSLMLNVVGLLYRVTVPALFQTLGRIWRGHLSKKAKLAGGTK